MPLFNINQRREIVKLHGLDPEKYELTEDGAYINELPTKEQPVASSFTTEPKAAAPSEDSKTSTFLKSLGANIPGSLGAGLGAAGGLAIGGALLPTGIGTIPGAAIMLGSALGGGLIGGTVGEKVKEEVLPDAWLQNVAASEATNPRSALLGRVASIPAGGFIPGPSNVLKAGQGLAKLAIGQGLKASELGNIGNVGIGAIIPPATMVGRSIATGEPMPSIGELAREAAIGAVFNKPWALGRKMGFRDVPSIDEPNQAFLETRPPVPQLTPDTLQQLANRQKNIEALREVPTLTPDQVDYEAMKGETFSRKPFIEQAKEAPDSTQAAYQQVRKTFEEAADSYEKALGTELLGERPKIGKKATKEELNKYLTDMDTYLKKADEHRTILAEMPNNVQTRYEQLTSERIKQDPSLPTRPNILWYKYFNDLGALKREYRIEADGKLVNRETGKPIAGEAVLKDLVLKLGPRSGPDTLSHEATHFFINAIRGSKNSRDIAFYNKYIKHVESLPEYQQWAKDRKDLAHTPEEYIATNSGMEAWNRAVSGDSSFKQFTKDISAYWKTRFGKHATEQDFRRMMLYKLYHDPAKEGFKGFYGATKGKTPNEEEMQGQSQEEVTTTTPVSERKMQESSPLSDNNSERIFNIHNVLNRLGYDVDMELHENWKLYDVAKKRYVDVNSLPNNIQKLAGEYHKFVIPGYNRKEGPPTGLENDPSTWDSRTWDMVTEEGIKMYKESQKPEPPKYSERSSIADPGNYNKVVKELEALQDSIKEGNIEDGVDTYRQLMHIYDWSQLPNAHSYFFNEMKKAAAQENPESWKKLTQLMEADSRAIDNKIAEMKSASTKKVQTPPVLKGEKASTEPAVGSAARSAPVGAETAVVKSPTVGSELPESISSAANPERQGVGLSLTKPIKEPSIATNERKARAAEIAKERDEVSKMEDWNRRAREILAKDESVINPEPAPKEAPKKEDTLQDILRRRGQVSAEESPKPSITYKQIDDSVNPIITVGKIIAEYGETTNQQRALELDALYRYAQNKHPSVFNEWPKYPKDIRDTVNSPLYSEASPFYMESPKFLNTFDELGLNPDKKVAANLLINRIRNVMPAEYELLKEAGIDKLMHQNMSPKEMADWIEKNGPKVEVRKLEAIENKANKLEIQHAAVTHQLDTIEPNWREKSISEIRNSSDVSQELKDLRMKEYNLRVDIEEATSFSKKINNESATAKYTMVNPKPLDQMPGAVDLLVRLPVKGKEYRAIKEKYPDLEEEVAKAYWDTAKFRSNHYPTEGKNLVSHVRGYMETLPDGKKVFHVFEVQSDWAQEVRDSIQKQEERILEKKKYIANPEVTGITKKYALDELTELEAILADYIKETSDPILKHNERLAIKAAIAHAKEQGADYIAISDAETAMITEQHDTQSKLIHGGFKTEREAQESLWRLAKADNAASDYTITEGKSGWEVWSSIPQEKGMRLHYDQTLPKIASELTGGGKGEIVSFGEHQNAFDLYSQSGNENEPNLIRNQQGVLQKSRPNLIFKNADGSPKTDITARMYPIRETPERFTLTKRKYSEQSSFGNLDNEAYNASRFSEMRRASEDPRIMARAIKADQKDAMAEQETARLNRLEGPLEDRYSEGSSISYDLWELSKNIKGQKDLIKRKVNSVSEIRGQYVNSIPVLRNKYTDEVYIGRAHAEALNKIEDANDTGVFEQGFLTEKGDYYPKYNNQNTDIDISGKLNPEQNIRLMDLYKQLLDSNDVTKSFEINDKIDELFKEARKYSESSSFLPFLTSRIDKVQDQIKGPEGKMIAKALHQFSGETDYLTGQFGNGLLDIISRIKPNQVQKIYKHLYEIDDTGSSIVRLSPEEKKVADQIIELIREPRHQQNALGMKVKSKYGLRVGGIKPNGYMFNMLDPDVAYNWANDPTSAKSKQYESAYIAHRVKHGDTVKEAQQALNEYQAALGSRGGVDVEFGALRKAEGKGLPWLLVDKNFGSAALRYARRAAKDLAYFKYIQSQPKMLKALNLKDQEGNYIPADMHPEIRNVGSAESVKEAMRSVYGIDTPRNPKIMAAARIAANVVMGPGTAIRNLATMPAFLSAYVDASQVPLLVKAIYNMKFTREQAFKSNAIKADFSDFDAAGSYAGNPDTMIRVMDKMSAALRKYQGRDLSNAIEGQYYYSVGELLAADNIIKAKAGKKSAIEFLDKFGDIVEGGTKGLLSRKVTRDDVSRIAKRFTDRIRGTYGEEGLPSWAIEGELAPFAALSRFSLEKSNAIWKDVVEPMKKGNYAPMLKYALGSLLTGAAIEKINELLSNKKGVDPTVSEVLNNYSHDDAALKLTSLLQMASTAGIMSDFVKTAANASQGKLNQFSNPLSFPLATLAVDTIGNNLADYVKSIQDGEDPFDATGQLIKVLATQSSQTGRYLWNRTGGKEEAKDKEKFRDVRVWKELEDEPISEYSSRPNEFQNLGQKKFKKETDITKAASMIPDLLEKAVEDSRREDGTVNPQKLKKNLTSLKINNYQTMPNLASDPEGFYSYYNYLEKTQGKEKAMERLNDYFMRNTINKVKSSMVP